MKTLKHQYNDLLSIAVLYIYSTLKISVSNQQTQTFWMTISSLRENKMSWD